MRCGDAFTGSIVVRQSGTAAAAIVFASYGGGDKPVISGAVALEGVWQSGANGVYELVYANVPGLPIEQVFFAGAPMRCARHPNTGWLTIDSVISTSAFISRSLAGAVNWTGASIHVRSERWSLDWRIIVAHDPASGRVTLNQPANYELKKGWGFFINASRSALDEAGEWHYDSAAHRVYCIPPNGSAPVNMTASVIRRGMDLSNCAYIVVENLRFEGHVDASVYCRNASSIVVRRCDVYFADAYGMDLGCANSRIEQCAIGYPNVKGINLNGAGNALDGNSLVGVGMMHRLNRRGYGGGCCTGRGIDLVGKSNVIAGNILDSIGYIGIGFSGENNRIERNFINHVCMTIDDGAGIYTWSDNFAKPGSAGTVIRRNAVLNGVGAPQGATGTRGWVHGIYMDDRTHDIRIDSNTVAYNELGIFLHNNRRHIVAGNVCYANREAQIQVQRDRIVDSVVFGNQVIGNVCFATDDSQHLIKESVSAPNDSALARYEGNYLCAETRFGILCRLDAALIWEQTYFEPQSLMRGNNLIANGEFDSSSLGWGRFPAEYLAISVDNSASSDGACLRARYAGDPQIRSPLVYPSRSFALEKDAVYRLRFFAKESHPGKITVIARMAHAPWSTLGLSKTADLDTAWKHFEFFFAATASDTNCRIDFQMSSSDSLVWLDHVSLFRMDAAGIPAAGRSALFLNTASGMQRLSLGGDAWRAVDGSRGYRGSIALGSFESRILIKDSVGIAQTAPAPPPRHRPALTVRSTSCGVTLCATAGESGIVRLQIVDVKGRTVAQTEMTARPGQAVRWRPPLSGAGVHAVRIFADMPGASGTWRGLLFLTRSAEKE